MSNEEPIDKEGLVFRIGSYAFVITGLGLTYLEEFLKKMSGSVLVHREIADWEEVQLEKETSDKDSDEYYDRKFRLQAADQFEKIFHNTIIVMMFSILEQSLKITCKMERGNFNEFKEKLTKELNVDLPMEWDSELEPLRSIRNAIVHNGGVLVPYSPKETQDEFQDRMSKIQKLSGVRIGISREIFVSQDYCDHAIKSVRGVLKNIEDQLSETGH